jgi:hypothetical protein
LTGCWRRIYQRTIECMAVLSLDLLTFGCVFGAT